MNGNRTICGIAPFLTRRHFIATSAAAFCGGAFAIGTGGKGAPALKIGLLSDVHMKNPTSGDKEILKSAFEYYRERGADAVVIAGDLSDEGIVGQVNLVSEAWYEVFPKDLAPDGRKVEKVFIIGNHEHDAAKFRLKRILAGKAKGDPFYENGVAMADDFAGNWEKLFHEPWAKQYEKTVKGYKFFASHWVEPDEMEDIAAFIDPRLARYGSEQPFFHIQHPHPFGTLRGYEIHGTWMGKNAFKALAAHPNAVSFSGHSHRSLTDERTMWQGEFTAVGASTLRSVSTNGPEENAIAKKNDAGRMMERMMGVTMAKQGQFVEVYDDRIVIERKEFRWGKSLGPDRVIPWPPKEKPFAYAALARSTPVPQFAAGDSVEVSAPFDGHTRGGDPVRQVKVAFPAARAGGRAFGYDIEVSGGGAEPVVKKYLQEKLFLTQDHWPKKNEFLFPAAALEGSGRVLRVYPTTCFGKRGAPIEAKLKV